MEYGQSFVAKTETSLGLGEAQRKLPSGHPQRHILLGAYVMTVVHVAS